MIEVKFEKRLKKGKKINEKNFTNIHYVNFHHK